MRTGESTARLYAYDVDRREERLITDFGDTSVMREGSISPDRRWFVFSAWGFRLDEVDVKAIYQQHLWRVSVDGKQFVRLTHPLMPMDESCPVGEPGCMRARVDAVFSRDGAMIYYSLGTFWENHSTTCSSSADCGGWAQCIQGFCRGSQLEGGTGLSRISSDGKGLDDPITGLNACGFDSDPAFSHSGDSLLYVASICFGGGSGVHLKHEPFDQGADTFLVSADSIYGSPAWFTDDTGFLYVDSCRFDEDQDGTDETRGWCLLSYDMTSGESRTLLRPPAGAGGSDNVFLIMGFSPNADRSKVVLSVNHPQGTVNLFLLNLATDELEQLTTTNDAYGPVWYP